MTETTSTEGVAASAPDDEKAGTRRLPLWVSIRAGLVGGLVVLAGLAGVLGVVEVTQSQALSVAQQKLSAARGDLTALKSQVAGLSATVQENQSAVDQAASVESRDNATISALKTQLSACEAAASAYGGQAIADSMAAAGINVSANVSAAAVLQQQGKSAGCPGN